MVDLKIVGTVNDFNDANTIEDIVKIFLVENRIYNLLSLEKKKNFKKESQKITTFLENDLKFEENSNEKFLQIKNYEDFTPVFNVRGLF